MEVEATRTACDSCDLNFLASRSHDEIWNFVAETVASRTRSGTESAGSGCASSRAPSRLSPPLLLLVPHRALLSSSRFDIVAAIERDACDRLLRDDALGSLPLSPTVAAAAGNL